MVVVPGIEVIIFHDLSKSESAFFNGIFAAFALGPCGRSIACLDILIVILSEQKIVHLGNLLKYIMEVRNYH